jgi:alpha-L-fucosidase
MEDPSIAGNDDNLQVRLECVVDVLRRSTEAEVRNHLARVQEYFVNLNPDKYVNEEEAAAYAEYLNDR